MNVVYRPCFGIGEVPIHIHRRDRPFGALIVQVHSTLAALNRMYFTSQP